MLTKLDPPFGNVQIAAVLQQQSITELSADHVAD